MTITTALIAALLIILLYVILPRPWRRWPRRNAPLNQTTPLLKHASLFEDNPRFSRLHDIHFRLFCQAEIESIANPTPSKQQWEMILSPATATYVIAGAGSGKTTSLAYRVLLMNKLLDIPLSEIRVFSFTRASRKSFQRKLVDVFAAWEQAHGNGAGLDNKTQDYIEAIVTTFHASINRIYRNHFGQSYRIFEFLGKTKDNKMDDIYMDNPVIATKTTDAQETILARSHAETWKAEKEYRDICRQLLVKQDIRDWSAQAPHDPLKEESDLAKWLLFLANEKEYHGLNRDDEYGPPSTFLDYNGFPHTDPFRAAVANWLISNKSEFTPLPSFCVRPPRQLEGLSDGVMYAAFKVDNLVIHAYQYHGTEKTKLSYHEWRRKRIINFYLADQKSIELHKLLPRRLFDQDENGNVGLKPEGKLRLMRWITSANNVSGDVETIPQIDVQFAGMIEPLPLPIYLYTEGCFVEYLGLEVDALLQLIDTSDIDVVWTAKLLQLFWNNFEKITNDLGIVRFHQMFKKLSRSGIPQHRSLQHLLVDEFQDVSPEIISWLKIILQDNSTDTSLLCVGDDWQSIYGWRGSDPGFLINFESHFRAPTTKPVLMEDNFRSRQPIINAGEYLLKKVGQKTVKKGLSSFQAWEEKLASAIAIKQYSNLAAYEEIIDDFAGFINNVKQDIESFYQFEMVDIKILARKNKTIANAYDDEKSRRQVRKRLEKYLGISVRLDIHSFHKAKGLEADFVLLLNDALPPSAYPFRDFIYRISRHPLSYTESQTEEAYRLGYVAITRARYGAMWAIGENEKHPYGCFALLSEYLKNAKNR